MGGATLTGRAGGARPVRLAGWPAHLMALSAVVLALLALFAGDAAKMASIWWGSSTYEHCLVILPVIGWLVWIRRDLLAGLRPRGWALPLLWVAAGGFGWLLGEAAGVAFARHLGLVMMLQGAVAVLLGRAAAAVLAFPLFYALFLVPAGDALVPPLQTVTARMCLVLLHLARVPATLDGVFITTPGGWFKVAEACSGAKFLIAMIALGALVAHLGFRGWGRRIGFLALCVVVPVLANGVRAFSTIWVAQYKGAKAAGSFDHVVYGWFFFAAVIAAVLAVSWRFFDRAADAAPMTRRAVAAVDGRQRTTLPLPVAACAVVLVAAAAPTWAALIGAAGGVPVAADTHLPAIAGWTRVPAVGVPWRPRFDGADRLLTARYRDAGGAEVDVAVALFARSGEGRELVGYGRGAVDPDGPWAWAADEAAPAGWLGQRIEGPDHLSRAVLTSYRVGAVETGQPTQVKIAELRHRLLGGDQRSAALLLSAEQGRGGRAAIDRLAAALGDPGKLLDRVAAGR